ncbi:pachytene checkpoint protein 2 homolog [Achroia grisella]|uniref:pachytene checkpoint protein 2 homolog n=1 Tax=Achroia grisella TaxID=688607 RepID=UPI0027D2145F|nr:pachytene checkpoint protein 2 homolog [Achroia grisella]
MADKDDKETETKEFSRKRKSSANKDYIKEMVHSYLSNFACLNPGTTIAESDLKDNNELQEHIQSITLCDIHHKSEVQMTNTELVYHIYKLDSFGVETDTLTDSGSGEELPAADVWTLPSEEFHGLWESLIYDSSLKEDTLRFAETAFEFADRGVNSTIVGCNRVILLHGPPGTGKTSLCRALAQKLSIRLGDKFPRARLLEINAHGLFSKWFSESGKIVARLFDRVREIVEDRRLLACVLVDEVESLAHARRAAVAGLEPSDSIRAVNAILAQLDRLRRHPNALVLTTSNVTGAIDVAFVDRADVKRLVGRPSARAAYEILRGCCEELMARGAVAPRERLFALRVLEGSRFAESEAAGGSLRLWAAARAAAAARLSARALRRLPLQARALHCEPRPAPPLQRFLRALQAALARHVADCDDLLRDEPV